MTPLKSEPLVRLLIADLVEKRATRAGFATVRDDIEGLRSRLDDARKSAEALPQRREYLLLANDFLRGLLDLYDDLAEKVERL